VGKATLAALQPCSPDLQHTALSLSAAFYVKNGSLRFAFPLFSTKFAGN